MIAMTRRRPTIDAVPWVPDARAAAAHRRDRPRVAARPAFFTPIYSLSGFIKVACGENSMIDDLHACVRDGGSPVGDDGDEGQSTFSQGRWCAPAPSEGRAMTSGARLAGIGSQRFGTVAHRDRVPPRAREDA